MDVRLVVAVPSKPRKSYAVRLPIVVGREAKFRIPQDSVSRQHCRFSIEDGIVCVTDLGSTNGTLVAGTRIEAHAATPVSPGTEVQIGGIMLRVEYDAVAAAAATREGDPVEPPAAVEPQPAAVAAPKPGEPATVAVRAPTPAFPDVAESPAATDAPAFPDVAESPAADAAPAFSDVDAAPAAAEGSFDFLGDESAASAPPDDDNNLNDFFKSLS